MKSARVLGVASAVMVALVLVLAQGCDYETQLPELEFSADRGQILEGECTTLRWKVPGVREYDTMRLDGEEVAASGTKEVCPRRDTSYRLSLSAFGKVHRSAKVSIKVVPREPAEPAEPLADVECSEDSECCSAYSGEVRYCDEHGKCVPFECETAQQCVEICPPGPWDCNEGECFEPVVPQLAPFYLEGTAPDGVDEVYVLPSAPTGEVCGETWETVLEGLGGPFPSATVDNNQFVLELNTEEFAEGESYVAGASSCPDGVVDGVYASGPLQVPAPQVTDEEYLSQKFEEHLGLWNSCGCAPAAEEPSVGIPQIETLLQVIRDSWTNGVFPGQTAYIPEDGEVNFDQCHQAWSQQDRSPDPSFVPDEVLGIDGRGPWESTAYGSSMIVPDALSVRGMFADGTVGVFHVALSEGELTWFPSCAVLSLRVVTTDPPNDGVNCWDWAAAADPSLPGWMDPISLSKLGDQAVAQFRDRLREQIYFGLEFNFPDGPHAEDDSWAAAERANFSVEGGWPDSTHNGLFYVDERRVWQQAPGLFPVISFSADGKSITITLPPGWGQALPQYSPLEGVEAMFVVTNATFDKCDVAWLELEP